MSEGICEKTEQTNQHLPYKSIAIAYYLIFFLQLKLIRKIGFMQRIFEGNQFLW